MEDERFSASFDFPSEHTQRGEMEPSAESSSFLSMRSWLLNEGVIMSPGDVSPQWSLEMSGADVDFGEVQNRPDQQTVMVLPPSSEFNSPSDCGNFGIRYPKSSRNTSCANHCKLVHIDATASPALRRKRTLADQASSIGTPKIDPGGRHEELIEVVHTTQSKVGLAHCKDVLHSPPGGSPVAPPEPRGLISQGTSEQICAQSLSAPDKGPLRFDSAILWLLSRFSYALQPTGLVSELMIRTLLDYITVAQQPSARAGRILHRLTCNPNCLEVFVRSRGPALLHMRLIHGVFPEALLRGTFESHSHECRQRNVARHRQDSHRSNGDEQPKVECDLDENSTLSTSSHQKLGSQLLRNLRVQAVSDFGVGTLAHMLLAARSDDRVACALALPYMYRNEPLRRKMLVEYSGLRFLLHTMLQCTDASYMPMAVDALSCLSDVQTRNLTADSPGRKYFMEEATTVPEHAAVFRGDTLQEPHCAYRSIQEHLNCLQCGSNIFTDCQCVLSSAEGSDVVYFRLDSGKLVRAHRSTVAGSSEVFAAMLQGHFAEACLNEIPVCDVTDSAFLLLMHHLHGCNLCTCPILCANCTIHTSGPFDDDPEPADELKDEVETIETTLNNSTQHFAIGKPFPNELSQLMALANRFLLGSLKSELTSLMQSQLSWHYLSQVFAFAHLHGFEDLCLSCLRYLCTAPLSLFQRTLCLQHIMQSGVDVEKMEDILHSVLLLYT
uniref:BTB domain-containing protein n=1 Tax=Eptatretus burgeri TaxID=7764 RepID=A0A8C4NLX4_EPTBU